MEIAVRSLDFGVTHQTSDGFHRDTFCLKLSYVGVPAAVRSQGPDGGNRGECFGIFVAKRFDVIERIFP